MATKRQQILEAFRTRLQAIDGTGAFVTTAGLSVSMGERKAFGPDDATVALAILAGEDVPLKQQVNVPSLLEVRVQALASADLDEPWIVVEDIIGDIKKAVELADRTLGSLLAGELMRGQIEALERDPGSDAVGAVVPYAARYVDAWGGA